MPESGVCKEVKSEAYKKQSEELKRTCKERRNRKRLAANTERRWVPWVFIPIGLLGVLWMVIRSLTGNCIGPMRVLIEWNTLTALGLTITYFGPMALRK